MTLDIKPSLVSVLSADIRSRAGFLPFCPLCSHVHVEGFPDMLIGPAHRKITTAPNRHSPSGTVSHKIEPCCALSTTGEQFDSPAAASAWWRARRMERHPDPATDSRRVNTLARLKAASLEAIE